MAGLVLVMDRSDEKFNETIPAQAHRSPPEGVDGVLKSNGVLKFSEMVDM